MGVLVGCTPFFGVQILLALLLAWLFGLNRLAAMLGAQVSMPPLNLVIAFIGIQVGELVLHRKLIPLGWGAFAEKPLKQIAAEMFLDFLVGGLIVGAILGAIGAVLTMAFVNRFRSRPPMPTPSPGENSEH